MFFIVKKNKNYKRKKNITEMKKKKKTERISITFPR